MDWTYSCYGSGVVVSIIWSYQFQNNISIPITAPQYYLKDSKQQLYSKGPTYVVNAFLSFLVSWTKLKYNFVTYCDTFLWQGIDNGGVSFWLTPRPYSNCTYSMARIWAQQYHIREMKLSIGFASELYMEDRVEVVTEVHDIRWTEIRWLEDITSDKWRQFQNSDRVSECTVDQELLWLWYRDSLGTQEGKCPLLETSIRGPVRKSRLERLNACVMNCRLCEN
jgi:hypothetical protein